jgi:hypothetical protein
VQWGKGLYQGVLEICDGGLCRCAPFDGVFKCRTQTLLQHAVREAEWRSPCHIW